MMDANDRDTTALLGREPDHVGKIEVERNQAPFLRASDLKQASVRATLHVLVPDRPDVMPRCPEHLLRPGPEVLVQLELHPAATSTNRSRDISAP